MVFIIKYTKWHSQSCGNIDFGFSCSKKYPLTILKECPGGVTVDTQGEIIILNYQNFHKNGARWWENDGKLLPVDRTWGGN